MLFVTGAVVAGEQDGAAGEGVGDGVEGGFGFASVLVGPVESCALAQLAVRRASVNGAAGHAVSGVLSKWPVSIAKGWAFRASFEALRPAARRMDLGVIRFSRRRNGPLNRLERSNEPGEA